MRSLPINFIQGSGCGLTPGDVVQVGDEQFRVIPATAKRLIVIIDGVRFEVDDATADAGLVEEISRVIKGLFKILEKRAQKSATA